MISKSLKSKFPKMEFFSLVHRNYLRKWSTSHLFSLHAYSCSSELRDVLLKVLERSATIPIRATSVVSLTTVANNLAPTTIPVKRNFLVQCTETNYKNVVLYNSGCLACYLRNIACLDARCRPTERGGVEKTSPHGTSFRRLDSL